MCDDAALAGYDINPFDRFPRREIRGTDISLVLWFVNLVLSGAMEQGTCNIHAMRQHKVEFLDNEGCRTQ